MAYGLEIDEFLGRRFTEVGDEDCYTLTSDFYKRNFDMTLTNFARPADWSSDDLDLITELYEHDGFKKITEWKPSDLRPGDVLALTVGEGNPNHLAIYLGDDEILHHLRARFSRVEPFHGFWRNHVSFILRHPDVPDLRPPKVTQDLAEFIRARNAPPTE
jgi:cell wall-associated NlpC family hydrolase